MIFIPWGFWKLKKILWNIIILWQCFILISKNANGIKYFTIFLAVIYQCNFECVHTRKYCEAIMDDLLLFLPSKRSHMAILEDLMKALLKNGLKISPKKCQLFRTELQYTGNTIFTRNRRVYIKPLWSILEAIQKLKPPTIVKVCRSFEEMVNFLSLFCPELQKFLKPIYDLKRKGRQFIWEEEQQTAFEEIKCRLIEPPVLHLPDNKARFHLCSDTSKFATGSALYQIQNGKPN